MDAQQRGCMPHNLSLAPRGVAQKAKGEVSQRETTRVCWPQSWLRLVHPVFTDQLFHSWCQSQTVGSGFSQVPAYGLDGEGFGVLAPMGKWWARNCATRFYQKCIPCHVALHILWLLCSCWALAKKTCSPISYSLQGTPQKGRAVAWVL